MALIFESSSVNCSLSIFKDLTRIGAICIQHNGIDFNVNRNIFSHCTRANQSGGAIYCLSSEGNCSLKNNCFEWCFTTTFSIVDYGQSAFCDCSRIEFFDNSFVFCSPDEAVIRNAGFCAKSDEAYSERVNASHGTCYYSAGIEYWGTVKACVADCTLSNLTSRSTLDTLGVYLSKGDSLFTRIIYITCKNPANGVANQGSTFSLAISKCLFVRCTNFGSEIYFGNDNTHTSESLHNFSNINKCNNFMFSCKYRKIYRKLKNIIIFFLSIYFNPFSIQK